ncbi:MAG: TIGR02466 family protein [Pseudomonadota bacterium]|nr:TIGR02466 family protein [Pseudomonadota bacterium]
MPLEKLFPTYVYNEKLKSNDLNLRGEILSEAYKFRDDDIEGHKWCKKNYVGGYTSYGSLCKLHKMSPTFNELKKQIDKHVKKYIQVTEMDLEGHKIEMNSCWVSIMPAQSHHSFHIHPQSFISGTYYVSTPKNSSVIKFEDPRLAFFMGSPSRKSKCRRENQHFVAVDPREGNVVLFESWLRHEVPANTSETERVSVSFNYSWNF